MSHPPGEKHFLLARIDRLRRRTYWIVLAIGLCRTLLGGGLLLAFLLAFEAWWQPGSGVTHFGIRAIWSVFTLSLIYFHLVVPLKQPLPRLQIARRIGRHSPEIASRLVNAVDFLENARHPSPSSSPTLRRRLLHQVEDWMRTPESRRAFSIFSFRQLTREAIGLAVLLLCGGWFFAAQPDRASASLREFFLPFRETSLDSWGIETNTPRHPHFGSPRVEAVLYTPGYESLTRRSSGGPLVGYTGDIAQMNIAFPHPIRSAVFHFVSPNDSETTGRPDTVSQPCTIDKEGGGTRVAMAWELEVAGEYYFSWLDEKGRFWESRRRYPVRILSEPTPQLVWESPTPGMAVVPDARLPIRFSLFQERGIKKIELVASAILPNSSETRFFRKTLFADGKAPPKEVAVRRIWEIGTMDLPIGTEVRYGLETELLPDREVSLPKENRRGVHDFLLQIVSNEQWNRGQQQRRYRLLETLQQLIRMQESGRRRMESLDRNDAAPRELLAELQTVESMQKELKRQVTASEDSLETMLASLKENEALRNEGGSFENLVSSIEKPLQALISGPLPAIERRFGEVLASLVAVEWKEGAGDRFIDAIPKDALEEIRDSQGEVLRLLREMESRFRLLSERQSWLENGRSLLDEQQALGESLSAFPDRATGLPLEMLSPAEQSTLTDWGEQQRRLAERLMELSRHDGEEATRFATLYRRMLETASAMEENRLGEARQKIDDLVRALASLLNGSDRSDTARSTEPAVLTNGRFAQVCARLAERQATLLDETKKIDRKLDALGGSISRTEAFALAGLAEEQELLAEKTREAAARRKNEPIWTALMRNASEKMEEATRFLQSQRTGPDCRNCQKQAIELLRWFLAAEKATGDTETTAMNPTSDQGETETTRSQTDLGRQLRILQALQRVLLHDTTRVDAARSTWETSKLNEEIQSLGTRQSLLAERTERLGSLFNREEMETMESTLAALAGMMGSVASRLTEGQVGPSIRQQQEEILEILLRLQGKSNGPPPGHDFGSGETTGQEEGSGESEGPTSEGEGEASGGDPTSGTAAGREKNGSDRSSADRESNELTLSEMGEVWGELPLKTRRRLGRFRRENFLPEYREMIESYYRRLSERGPKDKRDDPQEREETERRLGEWTE